MSKFKIFKVGDIVEVTGSDKNIGNGINDGYGGRFIGKIVYINRIVEGKYYVKHLRDIFDGECYFTRDEIRYVKYTKSPLWKLMNE
jgi:hypothetical protein